MRHSVRKLFQWHKSQLVEDQIQLLLDKADLGFVLRFRLRHLSLFQHRVLHDAAFGITLQLQVQQCGDFVPLLYDKRNSLRMNHAQILSRKDLEFQVISLSLGSSKSNFLSCIGATLIPSKHSLVLRTSLHCDFNWKLLVNYV